MRTSNKFNRTIGRFDYPCRPEVALPFYPLSSGQYSLDSQKWERHGAMNMTEIIYVEQGIVEFQFYDPLKTVILHAGEVLYRLPMCKREYRNISKTTAIYRSICFEGNLAEKFLLSYNLPYATPLKATNDISYLFNQLDVLISQNSTYALKKSIAIIVDILAHVNSDSQEMQLNKTINEALFHIQRDYGSKDFNINILANAMQLHRITLAKLFMKHLGKTPHQYLLDYRIEQAILLLEDNALNVQEISNAVGFTRCSYFIKTIKKYTGKTPGELKGKRAK